MDDEILKLTQVPAAITQGLQQQGIDVLTTENDRTATWTDAALLQRATALGCIIFTQDNDFLAIDHEWHRAGREFAGIIYAYQLRITIGNALRDLELMAYVLSADDMKNRIDFLPLR